MERTDFSPQRPQPLRTPLPIGTDPAAVRQRIEALEKVLERGFRIPGIGYEFGLDAIIGLVPVVGDFAGAAFGAYLVWEAKNLGMSKWKLWRMAGNVGVDTAIGFIPFAGDAFDFLFRSNTRNLKAVKRHLDKHHPATRVIES
jgi:hypothetical protein